MQKQQESGPCAYCGHETVHQDQYGAFACGNCQVFYQAFPNPPEGKSQKEILEGIVQKAAEQLRG